MLKKFSYVFLIISLVFTFSSCQQSQTAFGSKASGAKLKVAVSFNAMYEFAKAIGGDRVEITTIIPDGTEPHDFEPTPKAMISISTSDVFIYNGLNMESWVEDALKSAGNQKLIAVDTSKGCNPIKSTEETGCHMQYDPHLWLSISGAELQVKNIEAAFEKADPSHASEYKKNYEAFKISLDGIKKQYGEKLKSAENKSFVTGHAAFAYLCRDFGLEQNSVEDVFAEGEPSAQNLKKLITFCKSNNVKTVFAEEMASPAVSKTLADAVGAEVKTIYTIESAEDGKTYTERMKENIEEICESLT